MKQETSSPILALVALLGVVLLLRGLEAYNAHLDAVQDGPPARAASAPPPATPAPAPTPTPTPTPSAGELAALASGDATSQGRAIELLQRRAMTPELVLAIRRATPVNPFLDDRLNCLRARLPGRAAIDLAIARLAKEDPAWAGDMPIAVCLVSALASRILDDPARIRDALIPFAGSYPLAPREAALAGRARIREREMPEKLRQLFSETVHPSFPVRAALAMGLDESKPELVRDWLDDPESSVRSVMLGHLIRSPRAGAARQLAQAVVAHGDDKRFLGALSAREKLHFDATTALVEIALDEQSGLGERQRALELIGTTGDTGAIPWVHRLRSSKQPELRAYAESALLQLEGRLKSGSVPRMRPPRV